MKHARFTFRTSAFTSFCTLDRQEIEEPVKLLLEDYARFIDSTRDHVVDIVIKKNLWRDQDYRKWREQRHASQQGATKEAVSQKG